jgi:uncharacterized protein YdiU (UPF0061 family)
MPGFELNDDSFPSSLVSHSSVFFSSCFSRFGSFEILAVNGELAELKQLADFVLEVNFPHLFAHAESREVPYAIKSCHKKNTKKMTAVCSLLQKKREENFWIF